MAESFRLTQLVYEQLERQVTPPIVTGTTTELQAGYALGVQQVLMLLRNGFTCDTDQQAGSTPFRTRAR